MDELIKAELNRIRDEDARQNHRIAVLEQTLGDIHKLTESVHTLAHDMAGMLEEQKEQGKRLDALEQAPGRKWQRMSDKIVDTCIGILAGALMTGVIIMAAQYV